MLLWPFGALTSGADWVETISSPSESADELFPVLSILFFSVSWQSILWGVLVEEP